MILVVEPSRGSSEFESRDDETSSTSSEKYERDVTVLNHCFDDIEKFIARLQHAAAASRELERRQKYVQCLCLVYIVAVFCDIRHSALNIYTW